MMSKSTSSTRYLALGVGVSAALTAVVAAVATQLTGFEIVGKTVPFAYPWRLVAPTSAAQVTAWAGYLLHNVLVWFIIWRAQRERPKFGAQLRWFNWSLLGVHATFIALHLIQTRLFYDGLARDVPEITAQGSVALMLILILMLETPRRGLAFGKKVAFSQRFMQILRKYHGYVFSWATIYTFWYHPTEGTWGHLLGFFYMFMLFVQSLLIFNRAHLNKWWTFTLEAFVLVHGVVVAVFQGYNLWPMFAFGFGAMIVLTQMHGLGLSKWVRGAVAAAFLIGVTAAYAGMGRLSGLNEVVRIPVIEYLAVGLIYGLYLGIDRIAGLFRRQTTERAAAD
jgi:hypothetical protein